MAVKADTYQPSKPCKHGHLTLRRVKGNTCIECNVAAVQKYRSANRAKTRAYARYYYRTFPEKVRASQASYYGKNPGLATAAKRMWSRANPERHAATSMRTHTRKMNAPGRGVSAEERQEILDAALGICAYCNERKRLNLDHIEPLLQGGAHDVENIAPACKSCNSSKSDHTLLLWLARRSAA